MRIGYALLWAVLLIQAPAASAAPREQVGSASSTPTPVVRPAITEVILRNMGGDEVLVVLSRRADKDDVFYRNVHLHPGERALVEIPRLPRLRASILRYGDVVSPVQRQDRKQQNRSRQRAALAMGLALADSRRGREGRRDDGAQDRSDEDRNQRYPPPEVDHPPPVEHHPPERAPVSEHEEERGRESGQRSGNRNNLGTALVLGVLQSSRRRNSTPPPLPPAAPEDGFPGALVLLDSDDGSGSTIIHEVELGATVVNVSDDAEHDRAVYLGMLEGSGSSDAAIPCYCGPDMTEAYVAALKRVRDRIDALPDSEKGIWDGIQFLLSNAGSIDERVRPARKPGAGDETSDWLCPTGVCADLPGTGGSTMSLFGHCLPQHVGNDIMYGFVATLLGVPWAIQTAGGYYAEYASYGSIDPPQSRSAYKIGNYIADLSAEEITVDNVQRQFEQAWRFRELGGSLNAIEQAYTALDQCATCPADYIEPGQLLRDWSKSEWTLNDGSKVSPSGSGGQSP